MNSLIIIPARFSSTRFPGKPLAMIAGQTMLYRVVSIAKAAMEKCDNVALVVATEDHRIANHCNEINVPWVMTPLECQTGTDRALAAMEKFNPSADFVINLQGDAPLISPSYLIAILKEIRRDTSVSMITPITQLSWQALSQLRQNKESTPFSGTCAIVDKQKNALWFSKNIIPAIRNEEHLRKNLSMSPVFRHIGLYGYSNALLRQYVKWEPGYYEQLEGLEQLRVLENGHRIRCVPVESDQRPAMSGVDSPEDIKRAEAIIAQFGEPLASSGWSNL